MRYRDETWRWITYLVIVAFTLAQSPIRNARAQNVASAKTELTYRQAAEEMALMFRGLRKLRKTVDDPSFDAAAAARVIGPEALTLHRFVRDEIAFEVYSGRLRFADGALMSRAGNALDQSTLLVTMLRENGFEARYARARIPDEFASRLIGRTNLPSRARDLDPLAEGIDADAFEQNWIEKVSEPERKRLTAAAEAEQDAFLDALAPGFSFNKQLILREFERAGVEFPKGLVVSQELLLAAAKRHCWVQVRIDGRWVDLDPAAGWLEYGERLANPEMVADDLPTELSHQLQIKIHIDRMANGKLSAETVLDHSAYLTEPVNRIAISLTPEMDRKAFISNLTDRAFLEGFEIVLPSITVNNTTVVGELFDLEGNIVPADPALRAAASVREKTREGFGGLTESISQIGEELEEKAHKPRPELARVRAQLTLVSPNGDSQSLKRVIVGRPTGAGVAPRGELRRQMLGRFELLASAARLSPDYVQARFLDHIIGNRPLVMAALAQSRGRTPANLAAIVEKQGSSYPFELLLYLQMRSTLLDFYTASEYVGLAAYPSEHQLVGFRQRLTQSESGEFALQSRFDIMSNRLTAFEVWPQTVDRNRSTRFLFEQGIADTLIEYLMLGGGDAVSAHSVMAQAMIAKVPLALISPDNRARLDEIEIDAQTRETIAKDLEQGYLVLAPVRPVPLAKASAFAWWRIHGRTGATLGIGSSGEGQAMTEKVIIVTKVLLTSAAMCGLFAAFLDSDFMTCLVISVVTLPLGIGVYWVISKIVTSIAAGIGATAAIAVPALSASQAGRGATPVPPRMPLPGARAGGPQIKTPGVAAAPPPASAARKVSPKDMPNYRIARPAIRAAQRRAAAERQAQRAARATPQRPPSKMPNYELYKQGAGAKTQPWSPSDGRVGSKGTGLLGKSSGTGPGRVAPGSKPGAAPSQSGDKTVTVSQPPKAPSKASKKAPPPGPPSTPSKQVPLPPEIQKLHSSAMKDLGKLPGAQERVARANDVARWYRRMTPTQRKTALQAARDMQKLGVPQDQALNHATFHGRSETHGRPINRQELAAYGAMWRGRRAVSFEEFRAATKTTDSQARAAVEWAGERTGVPVWKGNIPALPGIR